MMLKQLTLLAGWQFYLYFTWKHIWQFLHSEHENEQKNWNIVKSLKILQWFSYFVSYSFLHVFIQQITTRESKKETKPIKDIQDKKEGTKSNKVKEIRRGGENMQYFLGDATLGKWTICFDMLGVLEVFIRIGRTAKWWTTLIKDYFFQADAIAEISLAFSSTRKKIPN